jgi:hypothetical protein
MAGNWTTLRRTVDVWIERAIGEARRGRFHAALGCYRQAEAAINAADKARGVKVGPCRLAAREEIERLVGKRAS